MSMQRLIGIALLIGGIVLLTMGVLAADSFGSQFKKFFTGSPTDRAIWLTLGGCIAIVVGAGSLMLPSQNKSL